MRWLSSAIPRLKALGAVCGLAILSAGCAFGAVGGKYFPAEHDGKWRNTVDSPQCGRETVETSSAVDSFTFHAYEPDLYF